MCPAAYSSNYKTSRGPENYLCRIFSLTVNSSFIPLYPFVCLGFFSPEKEIIFSIARVTSFDLMQIKELWGSQYTLATVLSMSYQFAQEPISHPFCYNKNERTPSHIPCYSISKSLSLKKSYFMDWTKSNNWIQWRVSQVGTFLPSHF